MPFVAKWWPVSPDGVGLKEQRMAKREMTSEATEALDQVLGYLNFSSGAADNKLLENLNNLYDLFHPQDSSCPTWKSVCHALGNRLDELEQAASAFRDAEQARTALSLVENDVIPGYFQFHRDLLRHQDEQGIANSFFLGRVFEAVLTQCAPWDQVARITDGAVSGLNDYIGYRPVAALESQKLQPYPHEWVRPVPFYVRDIGGAVGPYRAVTELAIELLANADEEVLTAAQFDLGNLDELAFDPRAYDFDHPVNRRPNYHFGQWDPHNIDNRGYYRRFVVQQVTLEALMERVRQNKKLPSKEIELEAAAVLAGTILMASGISGCGPGALDSNTTFANLLPIIAGYRDRFYEKLLQQIGGKHRQRLEQELEERRQPFGSARQHLNSQLALQRATQLEIAHLSLLFARMGYPDAATDLVSTLSVTATRVLCRIDCQLTNGNRAIDSRDLETAFTRLRQIIDLLERGIQCGAIIDPWNIIGFDARFNLFPSLENSIHDHRADELLSLMDRVFAYAARLWSEAAATDDQSLCQRTKDQFQQLVEWWHQFAVHEVSSVDGADANLAFEAAERVADAMNVWHKGGAATEDVAFWAQHAEMFDAPKAYTLVINSLLSRGDLVASLPLLIHWVSQGERVGLEQSQNSFHALARRWVLNLLQDELAAETSEPCAEAWKKLKKFFDYLEVNAEAFWRIPEFGLGGDQRKPATDGMTEEDTNDSDLFDAAYENFVYVDSTDDGIDGSIFETGEVTDDEFELESNRVVERLYFHQTLADLWKAAALFTSKHVLNGADCHDQAATLTSWTSHASRNCADLLNLLDAVQRYDIPLPTGGHDSMVDFDRRRMMKDALLEQIIATTVDMESTVRLLLASARSVGQETVPLPSQGELPGVTPKREETVDLFVALLAEDKAAARLHLEELLEKLADLPLLYVPIGKGGDPRAIVNARIRQQVVRELLGWLPRIGLLLETRHLLETARCMERNHFVGPGAVTEFDELFKVAFKAIVECLAASSESRSAEEIKQSRRDEALVTALEAITESLLVVWLKHSRTLRLSVIEKVRNRADWEEVVNFIQSYGSDLFTQRFLNLANLRGILHQGVDKWIDQLQESPDPDEAYAFLDQLDIGIPRQKAVDHLTLILDAITENYTEYRDYNSTTTQSDRGELLFTLLDFLRLRSKYDRVAWNLRPVVWVHEVLVRREHAEAAKTWRRSLNDKFREQADKYVDKLHKLQKQHAIKMPTVADRINERFVHPMIVDRVKALIAPAVQAANEGKPSSEFELLQVETEMFTREPSGVGLDLPDWLLALEEELEETSSPCNEVAEVMRENCLPLVALTLDEIKAELERWKNLE
jgi:hypothetical protein